MIIYNAIRTPDGTVIESTHRHDFVCHTDANGGRYCVDGGYSYLKRSFAKLDYKELSIDSKYEELSIDSDGVDFETVRNTLKWGTYGPNGDQPLKRVLLKDLTTDHIEAILENQHQISGELRELFNKELAYRGIK
jgi:hypothetical protein